MRIYAELGFKSYIPTRGLEKGMLFTYKLSHGHKIKEKVGVRKLEVVPRDEETFIQENGYPVYPVIIDDGEVIAEEAQIGWFDVGPESEDLEDITVDQMNIIMDIYEGEIAIEVDEETEEVVFMAGPDGLKKVVISYPEEWEEEEEWDDDDPLCNLCNGSGEGMYDGSTCTLCGGSGVERRRNDDPDGDWDDMDDDSWKED